MVATSRRKPRHSGASTVVENVVAEGLIDVWRRRNSVRGEQQHVAVGSRLNHQTCRNGSVGAKSVLDEELPPEAGAELLRDRVRLKVGAAAGRIADDHPHRMLGI